MRRNFTSEEWYSIWLDFLGDRVIQLLEIVDKYPSVKEYKLNIEDVLLYNTDFFWDLVNFPEPVLAEGTQAIKEITGNFDKTIVISPYGAEQIIGKSINKIISDDLGKLVYLDGLVRKVMDCRPLIVDAAYKCSDCGGITFVRSKGQKLTKPDKCDVCGKSRGKVKFELLSEESIKIDFREIEVQDIPEDLNGSTQPRRISAYMYDNLAKMEIRPGDRVGIYGIIKAEPIKVGNATTAQMLIYVDVLGIEKKSKDWSTIEISESDEEEIKKLASTGRVLELIKESIAPSIYGHDVIKEALVLQMFGGVPKQLSDGSRKRGDIHILLIGDPGTAKSSFLMQIANIAPRTIYTSGKGASAAGLTAAAVRDKNNTWVLEAGALVLADKGMACIDEIDKMSTEDRNSIHTAMEQQIVSIDKAGIHVILPSRCSILAAANPKYGRFDLSTSLISQIDLEPPLISRFDAIFKIVDTPNKLADEKIAHHILDTHSNHDSGLREPTIPHDLIRKYIVYAKRITPRLTKEAFEYMKNKYVEMRNSSSSGVVSSTPRQLEAMIRFAEASARMRLDEKVTIKDAEVAYRIVKHYLQDIAVESDGGIVDIDVIYGTSSEDRRLMKEILEYIRDMEVVDYRELYNKFSIYSQLKIDNIVEKLIEQKKIWEKNNKLYPSR